MMTKKFLLVFLVTLLCIITPPSFATDLAASSAIATVSQTESQQLEQQAKALYEDKQFDQAIARLQQVIQLYQAQGDTLRRAMAFSNLALVYQQLGDWTEANDAIQTSLTLLSKPANTDYLSAQAQALDIQGRLQLAQGQTQSALTSWQQAALRYQQLGDTERLVRNQIDQSRALQAMGLYQRAVALLTDLNQTLQTQPDSLMKAAGLRSLGDALRVGGDDLNQALQPLQDSLAVAHRLPTSSQSMEAIALAQLSLGNTVRGQQEVVAALTFYQQAESGSAATKLRSRLNQVSLLVDTQQWAEAQPLLPQIQQQLDELPLSQTAIYARINLAYSLVQATSQGATGQGAITAQLLSTAVHQAAQLNDLRASTYALGVLGKLYETTQQWARAEDFTRQALWQVENSATTTDIAYLWQWQLGRILKAQADQGIDPKQNREKAIVAYKTALQTLQVLRQDLVALNSDEQFLFQENVEPAYRQLIDLLLQTASEAALPNPDNLREARTTLESLQAVELQNFFRQACLDVPIEIDRVVEQSSALTTDSSNFLAAVIYPIILPSRLAVVVKLPNQADLLYYSTPVQQQEVKETLTQLRQQITQPETEATVQALSQQVYDWLIRPTEAALKSNNINTLVFVLDGFLKNIPMAALYDGDQYLIETYSIALTPGLKLLDPKPIDRSRISLLFAGLSEAAGKFEALAAIAQEKAGILAEVPDAVVLFNQDFTAKALQTEVEEKPFQIVHLATHGEFSSDRTQTFIQVFDRSIKVDELETMLRTRDQTRPDPIELLTLSACQTAQGDEQAALGLAGVAVKAGARSTLASLWSLDDETSANLMIEFYRQLISNSTLPKSVALQNAQLKILNMPGRSHPSYWAPYILLGNWL
jgi:CHAT domain-containing protein/tetratricopeptide (TPR) repeat protein